IITNDYSRGTRNDWVFDIYESTDGTVWAGTNFELIAFHPDDEQRIKPTRIDTRGSGFSFREIESVTEDRDGNLWLGTITGAMNLARNGFRTLNEGDGLSWISMLFKSLPDDLYAYGYVLGDSRASVFDGGVFNAMNPNSVKYWFSLGRLEGRQFT